MTLELVREARMNEPLTVRLLDDGRELASRTFSTLDLVGSGPLRLEYDAAREALERHDRAVALEQAGRSPGIYAETHFMQAVRALWPDLAIPCPRCDDSGEIQVGGESLNPRVGVRGPDPQCDDVVRCPKCHGTGA